MGLFPSAICLVASTAGRGEKCEKVREEAERCATPVVEFALQEIA